jgi:hypothetical protein
MTPHLKDKPGVGKFVLGQTLPNAMPLVGLLSHQEETLENGAPSLNRPILWPPRLMVSRSCPGHFLVQRP